MSPNQFGIDEKYLLLLFTEWPSYFFFFFLMTGQ